MPKLKVFSGGQWRDSLLAGAVDFGGQRITFAPDDDEPAFVDEFFTFPTPAQPDWSDASLSVGCRFAVTAPGTWVGNRVWLAPTPSDGITESVQGFDDALGALIAPVTPLDSGLSRGQYVNQMFTTPAGIVPGVDYTASFFTRRYGFTRPSEGAVVPFISARVYTDAEMAGAAFFDYSTASARPASSSSAFHFHVSPIVRFPV